MKCSFNHLRRVSEDDDGDDDECWWAQAALPEPEAPPAAGREEAAAAVWREEVTSSSSASWGRLWAGRPRPHPRPAGRIWRNGPPGREKGEESVTPQQLTVSFVCFTAR